MHSRHNHQCAAYQRKLAILCSPRSRGCRGRAPSLCTICSKACATPCTVCTPGALDLASDAVGTQDNSRTVGACRRAECDSLMCWVSDVSQRTAEIMHLAHMNREPLLPPPRG